MDRLEPYVRAWSESTRAVRDLCARLSSDDWDRPTDCPGWTVHDVLAHLAAIESELAATSADSGPTRGNREVRAAYTERGVRARRGHPPDRLLAELGAAAEEREQQLRTLPDDPGGPARAPGGVDWDWETLLRNRAIDLWVHEQDIRRAVGIPGSLDGPPARLAVETFAGALGYVLGKKVAPPAGTTVAWHVCGPVPFEVTLGVQDDGRARAADPPPAGPTASLTMSTETFVVLATGRHPHSQIPVELAGDIGLCGQVLSAMAVTS